MDVGADSDLQLAFRWKFNSSYTELPPQYCWKPLWEVSGRFSR